MYKNIHRSIIKQKIENNKYPLIKNWRSNYSNLLMDFSLVVFLKMKLTSSLKLRN